MKCWLFFRLLVFYIRYWVRLWRTWWMPSSDYDPVQKQLTVLFKNPKGQLRKLTVPYDRANIDRWDDPLCYPMHDLWVPPPQ